MLHFYDFEVFKYDWLVVIINPETEKKTIIINDPDKLLDYYEKYKEEIFVGYNSSGYDQFIFKGILWGFNPKEINDYIICEHKNGSSFSNLFYQTKFNNFDIMTEFRGLKQLEGFMGNDIRESSVPFDIDRKLTSEEIKQTVYYCTHDVEQTIEVFLRRLEVFESHMGLIKAFNLPLDFISKSKTFMISKILGAVCKKNYNDEFEISIPKNLVLNDYKCVQDWYENEDNRNYDSKLEIDIYGVPHVFGWGGVHGAITNYIADGSFIMADVASLYPSLMINYNYFSRSITDPKKYIEIYETNLKMKKEKNPLRPAYKLVCNTTYGCFKDQYNAMYDPLQANNICVAGQLLLLDLIEKIKPYCELIQSNTDGVLIKYDNTDETFKKIDEAVIEWEDRTGLVMEFSEYKRVFQGDVNNYIVVDLDGKSKSKGLFFKKQNDLDNDLPIVNKALNDFIVKDIPIEQTINDCNDLIMFQRLVKVSSKYLYAVHGKEILKEKTLRVFASKDLKAGGIFKAKNKLIKGEIKPIIRLEKFSDTSENVFIDNSDIKNKKVNDKLDKQWYIDLSYKRFNKKFKK